MYTYSHVPQTLVSPCPIIKAFLEGTLEGAETLKGTPGKGP